MKGHGFLTVKKNCETPLSDRYFLLFFDGYGIIINIYTEVHLKLPTLSILETEALEIQRQLQETGELTPELDIRLDENKHQLALKLDHYCYAYLSIDQKLDYLSDLKKQILTAEKSLEKQKDYLMSKLDMTKDVHGFQANNFKFSYRKSTQVVVTDIDKLPVDCVRLKTEPDKVKIKERLEQGLEVDGASIETNMNLNFKEKL